MRRLRSFRYVFSVEFLLVLASVFALCAGSHTLIRRLLFEIEVQQFFAKRQEKASAILAQDAALLDGLAHSFDIVAYALMTKDGAEANVVKKFSQLMRRKPVFSRIRYIDKHGQERISVTNIDGDLRQDPRPKLKNVSNHYYFADTLLLSERDIFFSSIEPGKNYILPGDDHVPTIYLATPVFIERELHGIVVIDINAREQLKKLERIANQRSSAQVYIANSDGYFLLHPIKEMEWGFAFKGRERSNMRHIFPRSWDEMLRNKEGVISNDEGYFIYTTHYPTRGIQEFQEGKYHVFNYFSKGSGTEDLRWTVFIRIPYRSLLWDLFRSVMVYYIIAYSIFLVLWVVARRRYGTDTHLTSISS